VLELLGADAAHAHDVQAHVHAARLGDFGHAQRLIQISGSDAQSQQGNPAIRQLAHVRSCDVLEVRNHHQLQVRRGFTQEREILRRAHAGHANVLDRQDRAVAVTHLHVVHAGFVQALHVLDRKFGRKREVVAISAVSECYVDDLRLQ
jgi:hypothetical protein